MSRHGFDVLPEGVSAEDFLVNFGNEDKSHKNVRCDVLVVSRDDMLLLDTTKSSSLAHTFPRLLIGRRELLTQEFDVERSLRRKSQGLLTHIGILATVSSVEPLGIYRYGHSGHNITLHVPYIVDLSKRHHELETEDYEWASIDDAWVKIKDQAVKAPESKKGQALSIDRIMNEFMSVGTVLE